MCIRDRFDAAAFANAIQFNMDAEDLTSLMTNYANASKLTYETNLTSLGYADAADPQSIRLYPKDFEAKERVLASIDGYNERMKAQGEEDKAVSYTDYMGVLMSGVTDIVDMISLVLIAFVSISLVVSSIMIGIITYISVLERTKEIGILRAIGASKKDVSHVFNAETFIIGLAAGVLGIAVTMLLNIPINVIIEQVSGCLLYTSLLRKTTRTIRRITAKTSCARRSPRTWPDAAFRTPPTR